MVTLTDDGLTVRGAQNPLMATLIDANTEARSIFQYS